MLSLFFFVGRFVIWALLFYGYRITVAACGPWSKLQTFYYIDVLLQGFVTTRDVEVTGAGGVCCSYRSHRFYGSYRHPADSRQPRLHPHLALRSNS